MSTSPLVDGTGLAGEITRDDVIRQASQASVFRNIQTPEWGEKREERIPVKGVRKAIATAMVSSAFTAPHVSVFTDINATRTMEFVKRLKDSPDFAGVRVSPLLVMAKAVIWAVRRNPTVNSSWTDKEIIVHHYVNLGIAAATPARPHRAERQGRAGPQPARARAGARAAHDHRPRRQDPAGRDGEAARSRSPTSARTAWIPARRS